MSYLEFIFFFSLFGVSYSYFIYPLILMIIIKLRPNQIDSFEMNKNEHDELPMISFIITAYNEENGIANKIENTLLVKYPKGKLEIIVASDGSSDETNSIVEKYKSKGIILHPVKERKGKENAQRSAIKSAKGSILVFSDVSTQIEKQALNIIADKFQNPKVGAVSSEDRFISQDGEVAGEGAYVKYEMWLRKLESNMSGLVGLSGSFFAARKDVCHDWNINIPSDFNTALNCIKKGYHAVTAPELLGFYPNLKDETKEYQRKVRTVIRGMAALFSQAYIMNPIRYKSFAFQVISHKLMRWLVPCFLIVTFVSNLYLITTSALYSTFLAGQVLFYIVALIGYYSKIARSNSLVKVIYFFVQVNIAIFQSSILFILGKRVTLWQPSKR